MREIEIKVDDICLSYLHSGVVNLSHYQPKSVCTETLRTLWRLGGEKYLKNDLKNYHFTAAVTPRVTKHYKRDDKT